MWILRLFNRRAHSSWRSLQARQAVLLQGVPILPPVDIVISHMVTAPVDIVFFEFLEQDPGGDHGRACFLPPLWNPVQHFYLCWEE